MRNPLLLLLLLLVFVPGAAGGGSGLIAALEKRLEEGELVWLQADNQPFPAIWQPAEGEPVKGGMVLLHDLGGNPDDPLMRALRRELSTHGWAVLAPLLPLPTVDAPPSALARLFSTAGERVTAALEWLREKEIRNDVLAGHGFGALVALQAGAVRGEDDALVAIVVLSPGLPRSLGAGGAAETLRRLGKPLLEIYAGEDLPGIVRDAKRRRRAAAEAKLPAYRQDRLPGADHRYRGLTRELARRVRGWLDRQAAGREVVRGDEESEE